ncbi:PREDICTED: uncharacterized protein LOC102850173 [Elephantulus edwardii]|uniref:uncharacterized protein LOC102850173 n=1 Tax=Elephantulus edwardii TaxID=28737 RepID=UPI0003F08A35|nr:PREDICTED: uncharacterized protein LOC102850173 [Elephantulus edwardii]
MQYQALEVLCEGQSRPPGAQVCSEPVRKGIESTAAPSSRSSIHRPSVDVMSRPPSCASWTPQRQRSLASEVQTDGHVWHSVDARERGLPQMVSAGPMSAHNTSWVRYPSLVSPDVEAVIAAQSIISRLTQAYLGLLLPLGAAAGTFSMTTLLRGRAQLGSLGALLLDLIITNMLVALLSLTAIPRPDYLSTTNLLCGTLAFCANFCYFNAQYLQGALALAFLLPGSLPWLPKVTKGPLRMALALMAILGCALCSSLGTVALLGTSGELHKSTHCQLDPLTTWPEYEVLKFSLGFALTLLLELTFCVLICTTRAWQGTETWRGMASASPAVLAIALTGFACRVFYNAMLLHRASLKLSGTLGSPQDELLMDAAELVLFGESCVTSLETLLLHQPCRHALLRVMQNLAQSCRSRAAPQSSSEGLEVTILNAIKLIYDHPIQCDLEPVLGWVAKALWTERLQASTGESPGPPEARTMSPCYLGPARSGNGDRPGVSSGGCGMEGLGSTQAAPNSTLAALANQSRDLQEHQHYVIGLFLSCLYTVFLFPIGFVGNILILVVNLSFREKMTIPDLYFINLAAADLILVADSLIEVFNLDEQYYDIAVLCTFMSLFLQINMYSSIFFLTWMSFDRYVALAQAMRASLFRTKQHARLSCGLIWLASASATLVPFTAVHLQHSQDACFCFADVREVQWLEVTLGFLVPLAVIGLCYSLIARVLLGAQRPRGRPRRQKALRMIFAVVLVFFICWLPENVFICVHLLQRAQPGESYCKRSFRHAYPLTGHIVNLAAFSNSCLNPLIYSFLGETFRDKLRLYVEQKSSMLALGRFCHAALKSVVPDSAEPSDVKFSSAV